jgi:hypothetical protein
MLRKIFALSLLCTVSASMFAADTAELDVLSPAQRRLRKMHNETERAEREAKPRGVFSRDDASRIAVLLSELEYLNLLESSAAAPSPDGSKSDGAGSDADGGYILTAEERARLDKISSQIKLKLERAKIERELKSELDKPARHKNQSLIAKLSAEIVYIDAKLAVAGRDVYGAKS